MIDDSNEQAKPFVGIHFAKDKIKGDLLHGDKRGLTQEGAEASRLTLPPRGAPPAIHVYEANSGLVGKHPAIVARPHAYQVEGAFKLADVDSNPIFNQAKQAAAQEALSRGVDPKTASQIGLNEGEWALKSAGYHGYKSSSIPSNVVLFGDHKATDLSKARDEQHKKAIDSLNRQPQSPDKQDIQPQESRLGDDLQNSNAASMTIDHSIPTTHSSHHDLHPHSSDPAGLGVIK